MSEKLFSVWEGVYQSFQEAGGNPDAFDSKIWIKKQKDRIYEALKNQQTGNALSKDYPLSLVVAMLLAQRDELSVLDFGGGMGLHYLEVISKAPQAEGILNYHIVDGKQSISSCPKEMKPFQKLHFHDDFHTVDEKIDIVHIGSTLQYIEDWKEILRQLNNKFNPSHFVFSDLLVGNIPTFVSHQIYYDKKIPHLFVNLTQFLYFMENVLGLRVLFKTKFIREILGQEKVFPNHALPKEYRIDRSYNFVFYKP